MRRLMISGLLLVGLTAGASATWSATAETDQPAGSQPGAALTLDVSRHLLDPPGLKEGRAAKLESLSKIVAAAKKPTDRIAAHLATANWLLAAPTARPATRWVLGLDRTADRQVIAESAAAARRHLARARVLLDAHHAGEKKDDKKRQLRLELAAEVLEPFGDLFAAADLAGEPERYRSACGDAALSLAVAREADDASMAACALLWQSFAWASAGRFERALISLPDALTAPESLPYDFLNRLLRCRILADGGQHAAASALTIRIGASCKSWFPGQRADVLEAHRRLVAVLRYQIGRAWLEQLNASGSAAAPRLEAMLAGVQQSLLANDQLLEIYHLESAIPIIVKPPAVTSQPATSIPASSTSSPATVPASIAPNQTSDHPQTHTSPL